jgi:hypothetical protein
MVWPVAALRGPLHDDHFSPCGRAGAAACVACSLIDLPCGLVGAARSLLPHLERDHRIDAVALRAVMDRAFGGPDAAGGLGLIAQFVV